VTDLPAAPSDLPRWLNEMGAGSLNQKVGIAIIEASADRVVATMPVEGNTQPYGLLHGGASCVLAETLGSMASALHAGPGFLVLGIEINASHHRSAGSGTVTGVATALHRGRTMATYAVELTDDAGRRLCTARISCAIRPAPG
jgi:1,4-dihydroxy-2-naphthoyl-CoA hydrolase